MVADRPPEPPCEGDADFYNIQNVAVIPNGQETSDDEDVDAYEGYERLPIAPDEENPSKTSSDEEEEEPESNRATEQEEISSEDGPSGLSSITRLEAELVREVWSGPPPVFDAIVMDSQKVDEVKLAMTNIILPDSSIPSWANAIPEEKWKEELIGRIHNMNQKL